MVETTGPTQLTAIARTADAAPVGHRRGGVGDPVRRLDPIYPNRETPSVRAAA
jgi:hypothetical protein